MKIQEVFNLQKEKKCKTFSPSADARKKQLNLLKNWILQNRQQIKDAVWKDLRKPAIETDLAEIKSVLAETEQALKKLKAWMKPVRVPGNTAFLGTSASVVPEPAGVVLILAPWNFPFCLTAGPLVSAIAAGNSVILKPSEFTPATSALLEKMVQDLFPPEDVFLVNGGPEVAEELLALPFDHIFFTGSPAVGKKVMKTAAEHLTSVTLELGGQNPVIIHESADMNDTVQKLVYGKSLNTGQSCLSPNCVYLPEKLLPVFEETVKKTFQAFYGPGEKLLSNPDFGRIVNQKHFDRISHLIADAKAKGAREIIGGEQERAENFIPLTILLNPAADALILNEEIFGPALPVLTYRELNQVYTNLSRGQVPLAAYFFGKKGQEEFFERTRSGAVVINDTSIHFMHPNLPFGGKGISGMGKAHGHAGFLAFSHQRSVLKQRIGFTAARLVWPPYTSKVSKIVEMIFKWL